MSRSQRHRQIHLGWSSDVGGYSKYSQPIRIPVSKENDLQSDHLSFNQNSGIVTKKNSNQNTFQSPDLSMHVQLPQIKQPLLKNSQVLLSINQVSKQSLTQRDTSKNNHDKFMMRIKKKQATVVAQMKKEDNQDEKVIPNYHNPGDRQRNNKVRQLMYESRSCQNFYEAHSMERIKKLQEQLEYNRKNETGDLLNKAGEIVKDGQTYSFNPFNVNRLTGIYQQPNDNPVKERAATKSPNVKQNQKYTHQRVYKGSSLAGEIPKCLFTKLDASIELSDDNQTSGDQKEDRLLTKINIIGDNLTQSIDQGKIYMIKTNIGQKSMLKQKVKSSSTRSPKRAPSQVNIKSVERYHNSLRNSTPLQPTQILTKGQKIELKFEATKQVLPKIYKQKSENHCQTERQSYNNTMMGLSKNMSTNRKNTFSNNMQFDISPEVIVKIKQINKAIQPVDDQQLDSIEHFQNEIIASANQESVRTTQQKLTRQSAQTTNNSDKIRDIKHLNNQKQVEINKDLDQLTLSYFNKNKSVTTEKLTTRINKALVQNSFLKKQFVGTNLLEPLSSRTLVGVKKMDRIPSETQLKFNKQDFQEQTEEHKIFKNPSLSTLNNIQKQSIIQ
ncbi:UNKNOWN [Stylonychia lemnae]|uniref:Uncharacterized protein n=1 Tax=Stylonychia lemnae TaxID=5949 RepID=A0A077ZPZ6_STYLE|nr:UNKNOWN [Stylonychia lemnae]|eukprot:CDW71455.1 UNKNOWN [Stylonychia lemnae]